MLLNVAWALKFVPTDERQPQFISAFQITKDLRLREVEQATSSSPPPLLKVVFGTTEFVPLSGLRIRERSGFHLLPSNRGEPRCRSLDCRQVTDNSQHAGVGFAISTPMWQRSADDGFHNQVIVLN